MTEVFYAPDHVLISRGYHDPMPHRHLAKHLLIGLQDGFVCRVKDQTVPCSGICIGSDILHTIQQASGGLLVFLFDETSDLAEQLETLYLKGRPFGVLDKALCSRMAGEWAQNGSDSKEFDRRMLLACGLSPSESPRYDPRIAMLLDSLHGMEEIGGDTLQTLCRTVGLSQSRLSHIFKEQVGISLGSYLVLDRIRKTFRYVGIGEDLTTACIHAGFDSSSHFSATYKRMFGLSFRDFRKNTIIHEAT